MGRIFKMDTPLFVSDVIQLKIWIQDGDSLVLECFESTDESGLWCFDGQGSLELQFKQRMVIEIVTYGCQEETLRREFVRVDEVILENYNDGMVCITASGMEEIFCHPDEVVLASIGVLG